ncbi:hypothetical protein BJ322DRAFT_1042959, partial [Thelephora terrestris]
DSRHPCMLLTIICTRGFISVPLEIGGQDLSFVSTATISALEPPTSQGFGLVNLHGRLYSIVRSTYGWSVGLGMMGGK